MIQIRKVPDALYRRLKSRAALAGMSLSDYLLSEIRKTAMIVVKASAVAKPSRECRSANNKSARYAVRKISRHEKRRKIYDSEAAGPCFSHRKDKTHIRGIVRSRRIARLARCRY
jgi:hypothetical protein